MGLETSMFEISLEICQWVELVSTQYMQIVLLGTAIEDGRIRPGCVGDKRRAWTQFNLILFLWALYHFVWVPRSKWSTVKETRYLIVMLASWHMPGYVASQTGIPLFAWKFTFGSFATWLQKTTGLPTAALRNWRSPQEYMNHSHRGMFWRLLLGHAQGGSVGILGNGYCRMHPLRFMLHR